MNTVQNVLDNYDEMVKKIVFVVLVVFKYLSLRVTVVKFVKPKNKILKGKINFLTVLWWRTEGVCARETHTSN